MNKNELIVRVLATIRTDLAAKEMAVHGVLASVSELDDYTLTEYLVSAELEMNSAISYLNNAIARLNAKE